jgi:SpoVK/Ycf46/Vps4 family AAA+-type ATPase
MNKTQYMNQYRQKKRHDYRLLIDALDETDKNARFTSSAPLSIKTKEEMDKFIEEADNYFVGKSYNSPEFAGWNIFDILKSRLDINNPDLFDDPISVHFKRKNIIKKTDSAKKRVDIVVEIDNLDSIINLINDYPLDEKVEYNINMQALHKIKEPLMELNKMVGMSTMKENIVDQLLYYVQDLHMVDNASAGDFMHTVIYGPPGTGKTEVAKIIGKIFANLGILKKGTFKKVTRSDLVSGYLGQTAIKTRDVINECLGGCLFIDEAYSLGNTEKRDSFSKECIDTLCEAMSDHKHDLMVIIAGYERELNDCFFAYNQGLDSRFTWRFKTEDYKAAELYSIFLKKVADIKWKVDPADEKMNSQVKMQAWFERNMDYFKYYGRDIETLLSKIKIAHSRRIFCKNSENKTILVFADLEKGLELYLKNEEVKRRKENAFKNGYLQRTMYL